MAQYAATYTPAAPIIAKQVSYAGNPLLSAGLVKTAGYHAGGIGYVFRIRLNNLKRIVKFFFVMIDMDHPRQL